MRLLSSSDPDPAIVRKGGADASFVIICDHAGRRVPESLGDLGLPAAAFERHIAWDIGALALSERLAEAFDAPMIAQRYSRLVIDCNRDPAKPSAIPEVSDGQRIPGNVGLDPDRGRGAGRRGARALPRRHRPMSWTSGRPRRRRRSCCSSTASRPRMDGVDRPWDFGVLHDDDLAVLQRRAGRTSGAAGLGDRRQPALRPVRDRLLRAGARAAARPRLPRTGGAAGSSRERPTA